MTKHKFQQNSQSRPTKKNRTIGTYTCAQFSGADKHKLLGGPMFVQALILLPY